MEEERRGEDREKTKSTGIKVRNPWLTTKNGNYILKIRNAANILTIKKLLRKYKCLIFHNINVQLVAFFLGLLGLIALTHFCYTYNFEGKHAHILKCTYSLLFFTRFISAVFFYNFAGIPAHLALLFGLLRNNTSFF